MEDDERFLEYGDQEVGQKFFENFSAIVNKRG